MNNYSIIGLLISSIFLLGNVASCTLLDNPPRIVSVRAVSDISVSTTELENTVSLDTVKPVFYFLKVNEITLYDDRKTVVEKLGQPDSITKDKYIMGSEMYEYPNMNIGFYDDQLEYVEISADAETIQIDDTTIRITFEDLKKALGDPDYIAEDGNVYQRNEALIKVYINENTQEVTSVDFYHLSSV